jgi:hypothetical protein|tara:strand:- start:117 stop:620 length:504 start_codon:yes stop_codon:yes gene_type:complete
MKFLIISTFTFLLNIQYSFSADKVVINSDAGGRLIQAAMYPIYVIFLKGGDTASQKSNWVDKNYWASLDILEGPDKGKSVLFKLHPTRAASVQPEWCYSAGGGDYVGRGITCLNEGSNKELRFKANIQWAVDAPEAFKDRNFAEHPDVPGNGGQELLDKVRLVISIE